MSTENENSQPQTQPEQGEVLDLRDLIIEDGIELFSEYLSLSISHDGRNTLVSATTTEGEPLVYTATFPDMTADSLQSLLSESGLDDLLGS